jgi:hypothetical protein
MDSTFPIPLNVNLVWSSIVPRVRELCADSDTSSADLLAACHLQEAFLYTIGRGKGFVFVKPVVDPKSQERGMFVLCGYNYGTPREVWNAGLDMLASGMGATYIEFWSKRNGFERTGWTALETRYRREV